MKFNQLQAVTAVAEQGSLRAAARHLGMSQPALTRSIGELERELGATLFERRARGMAPTPVGEVFIRRARVIGSEARRAQEEVSQFLGGDQGDVEVCLSIVAHMTLLPTALPQFQKRYARTRLRIVEGSFPAAEPRLRDGSMDFYIGPSPERAPSREFAVEKLFDNTRAVFARRGHPRAKARSLAELTDEVWATTGITTRAESEFAQLFARHKLPPPRTTIQADSMLSLMTTLMSSDALAVTLRQYSEFPLTRNALQVIEVKEPLPAPSVVLIRRGALPLTPAAEYLADMFRRAAADYARR
ncbi:LysR substrate-binding domain-containing protein [Variovorax sp. J22P271]|uniref:LysR substrate-binding domain-containing protein n=1 Tax=Variovorax davisae TaxID=3053515 RepID=UPI002577EAC0|nr:LysR substrate-binding domain-containing protein [Variovorax sp. J22P271]MDM0036866.1 LysR substrate-binding domain-containing protein [Variovorax sp. J22P271]